MVGAILTEFAGAFKKIRSRDTRDTEDDFCISFFMFWLYTSSKALEGFLRLFKGFYKG